MSDRPLRALLLENVNQTAHAIFGAAGIEVEALAKALPEAELARRVKDFDLLGIRSKTQVTAAVLAEAPLLGRLTNLGLGNSRISDAGVERLAASPHLDNVEYLTLLGNPIGDRAAVALAASPHLGRLKGLWLMVTDIEAAGKAALRERFGSRVRF